MRIIDKIEEVIKQFSQHFDKIEDEFNLHNDYFKSLIYSEHDTIGQVLKHHLVVEHYLTNYLQASFTTLDFDSAKLSFSQKANLISIHDTRASFVKPGIIELNRIRNKFAHNLKVELSLRSMNEMLKVLKISRKEKEYDNPLEVLIDFSTVASTFLIVNTEEINLLFQEIFDAIKNHKG
ncbi:hypothetical protein IR010_18075 [Flavobacterium sp. MR2016-29]|uniref:hypothetical protein n=1 Tax=Flavobacterium sp. MR2016-29 TaxID=2783795 RepID=UPI00188BF78C|nr:hypothetical protein [Flavobacterium sp. MR2016-29]MBF4494458.1 hypothetical protein [Flavobacterium sp. MR2016-29]